VPLTQITTDASREFARMRLDEGVSNDTVNGSLRLLRRMLNIANEDNKIQVVPKMRLLKSSPARKGFLAKEQFDSLVSFLPVNLKPLVTFLYYCGVRLGEAKQIGWGADSARRGPDEKQRSSDSAASGCPGEDVGANRAGGMDCVRCH
jgi:integrase